MVNNKVKFYEFRIFGEVAIPATLRNYSYQQDVKSIKIGPWKYRCQLQSILGPFGPLSSPVSSSARLAP